MVSMEEAEAFVADGTLTPNTDVVLFLENGKRRRAEAAVLGLNFLTLPAKNSEKLERRAAPPVPPAPKGAPATPGAELTTRAAVPAANKHKAARESQPPAMSAPAIGLMPEVQTESAFAASAAVSASSRNSRIGFFILAALFCVLAISWARSADEETIPSGTDASLPIETPPAEIASLPTMSPVEVPTPPAIAEPEGALPSAQAEQVPAPRATPAACRSWVEQPPQLELCTVVQDRYQRLRRLYEGAIGAGETPATTLFSAIKQCTSRRCVEQRLDARIAEITSGIQTRSQPAVPTSPRAATDRSRPLRARGNEASWVTTDDYPSSALREEAQGTTATRLTVGADGRVTNCEVTGSSGNSALDQAACRNLQRRARFEPALDRDGNPTTGVYMKRVRWQLPKTPTPVPDLLLL